MRTEIYNCLQARWVPPIICGTEDRPHEEEMMSIFNFTNYDILYTLVSTSPIKRIIVYPFQWFSITRLAHDQHALITALDGSELYMKITRPSVTNKLIILVSHTNQYKYAPGTLGKLEKLYIEYLLKRGMLLFVDGVRAKPSPGRLS